MEDLVPDDLNANRGTKRGIELLERSLEQYGAGRSVVVDRKGKIIAGNKTVLSAVEKGFRARVVRTRGDEVVVVQREDLDMDEAPARARALALADNRVAEVDLEWDPEALQNLEGMEVPLGDFFLPNELAALGVGDLSAGGLTDPDQIPESPDKATTRRGDLWVLGDHRLLCGDSAVVVDVEALTEGEPVQLVNTDPPYNVRVEPHSNNAIAAGLSSFTPHTTHAGYDKARGKRGRLAKNQKLDVVRHPEKSKPTTRKMRPKDRPLENDFVDDAAFAEMLSRWFGNLAAALEPGCPFYVWAGYSNVMNYPGAIVGAGLRFCQVIVWVKGHPVLTRKDFMGNHESAYYGWKPGAAHRWYGPPNAIDVWEVKKISPQMMLHLTEKPVALAEMAMAYSSRPGDRVLDLFGGSGSTLIGAQQAGRRALLMELDPAYCDVIVERWEKFTGKKAERRKAKPDGAPGPVRASPPARPGP